MNDSFGVRGAASEERAGALGGVIFWRRYLPLVQTYCLRSIITIASDVSNSIVANVIVTPANMLIIRSNIYFLCLKISSKVSLANSRCFVMVSKYILSSLISFSK